MGYTKEEIEEFKAKDIRISRSGIVQALIQSGVFTYDQIIDSNIIKATAKEYLKWVWEEKQNETKPVEVPVAKLSQTWGEVAKEYALPIPTKEEQIILEKILDEYLKVSNGKTIRVYVLLQQIITKFKKYPSKLSSVKTVLESISLEDLF